MIISLSLDNGGSRLRLLLLIVCFVSAGCGERDRSSQFIPNPTVAESAVKAGMDAWKKDEPVEIGRAHV